MAGLSTSTPSSVMLSVLDTFRGELAALAAALIWAIASAVYAVLGKSVPALILNLAKGVIAIALLVLTLLIRRDFMPDTTPTALGLLMLSGVIGIGLGDTAYFEALNCLGARRGLLLESLAPPIAALIAWIFLEEYLSLSAWLGIGLTVLGVAWVVVERTPDTPDFQTRPRPGIIFGLAAAFAQASGAVLSRSALVDSQISPLWSTLIRLIAGVLVLLILVTVRRQTAAFWAIGRSQRLLGIIALTAVFSTYLAIWLQQTALKFTAAGIAQALGATSPLFVLPIAIAMGDRVSIRAVLGVFVAIAGVWLLFYQGM